jgi:ribonuclease HI
MTVLRLYTDGSCPAPGAVGGWAWILVSEHPVDSGWRKTPGPSTHQRCEVTAAIEGLVYLVASAYARSSCSRTADTSSAG